MPGGEERAIGDEGPFERAGRVRGLARDLWSDEYTLKVTVWEDGDFRIVAYHHRPERFEGEVVRRNFEELWHQASENGPDEAVYVETWHEGDAHRGEERQIKRSGPELMEIPERPDCGREG